MSDNTRTSEERRQDRRNLIEASVTLAVAFGLGAGGSFFWQGKGLTIESILIDIFWGVVVAFTVMLMIAGANGNHTGY